MSAASGSSGVPDLVLMNLVALVNGLSVYAVKRAVHSKMGPCAINFGRFLLSALLFAPWTPGFKGNAKEPNLQLHGGKHSVRVRDYWFAGLEIGLYTFATAALQAQGLRTTTVTRASYVIYLSASLVPFLSVVTKGTPLMRTAWGFLFASVAGSLLICNDRLPPLRGDYWTVAAACGQALCLHRIQEYAHHVDLKYLFAASFHAVTVLTFAWVTAMGFVGPQHAGHMHVHSGAWGGGGSHLLHPHVHVHHHTDAVAYSGGGAGAGGAGAGAGVAVTWRVALGLVRLHIFEVVFLGGAVTAFGGWLAASRQHSVAMYSTAVGSLEPIYATVAARILLHEPVGDLGVCGCCLVTGAAMLVGRWAVVAEIGGEVAEGLGLPGPAPVEAPAETAKAASARRHAAQVVLLGLVLMGLGLFSMMEADHTMMESQAHMPLRAKGSWGQLWSVRARGGHGNRWSQDKVNALP